MKLRLAVVLCALASAASSPGAGGPALRRVPARQVRLEGELGRRLDLTLRRNYMTLQLDNDFLRPFRQRQPKEKVTGYGRFTGLGMLIHAAVLFAEDSADPAVMERKNYLVGETVRTQSPSGYIGAYAEESDGAQLWTEYCFHDAAYIAYGLAEDYRHFKNGRSLEAARKLAGYLAAKWPQRKPGNNFTTLGAAEAFLSLYDLTGDDRYLRFAADEPMGRRYRIAPAPLASWAQELRPPRPLDAESPPGAPRRTDSVHMYRALATAMMQLRLNAVEPRDNLPLMPRRMVEGLTHPTNPALLITGGTGKEEVWNEEQDGRGHAAETCATVYGSWFFDEMMRVTGDLRYGDLIERATYNALFAAQDPTGRRICYFEPFSGEREYFERDSYCCPNNFRRGIAALPGLIYYLTGDGLAINMYTASSAAVELRPGVRLTIRQETSYPSTGDVTIHVTPTAPARFVLHLRRPGFASRASVLVNGAATKTPEMNASVVKIDRRWRPGDIVTVRLQPAARWVKGLKMQDGRAALLYGPLLYGLNPGRNPQTRGMDLRSITLDPGSVEGPLPDETTRPDGTAFRVRGWSPRRSVHEPADLALTLSEFVDPGSAEVYFRLAGMSVASSDELLGTFGHTRVER